MPTLFIGANIVWQIAAGEASDARFQFIEAEHIFIGILSLEKALMLSPEDCGLNPKAIKALDSRNINRGRWLVMGEEFLLSLRIADKLE